MSDNKEDIRITKTKKALTIAILTLLEQHPFSTITVNDLCQEALTSRSTFYMHFQDKYDLLEFCLLELKKRFRIKFKGFSPQDRLAAIYDFLHEHANIFKNIFSSETNQELHLMFEDLLIQDFVELLKKSPGKEEVDFIPIEVLAAYHAGGAANLLLRWVDENFATSKEDMAMYQLAIIESMVQVANM